MFFYAFPPFSIIPQVLQKLDVAQAQAILIVPNWPTQPWYPTLTKLLVQQPILLPKNKSNVTLPSKQGKKHPLGKKLELMACLLSGDPFQIEAFHQKLKQQYSTPGDLVRKNNIEYSLTNGSHMRINGMQIPFIPNYESSIGLSTGTLSTGAQLQWHQHSSEHIVCIHCFRGNFYGGYAPYGTEVHERVFSSQTGIAYVPSNTGYIGCSSILYLKTFYPVEEITLQQLTHELVMLCALVTAQRS